MQRNDYGRAFVSKISPNLGGTFHVALGAGYPETGSKNTSTIHWDMICDMREDSEMSADGDVIYRDGKFI